jgi:hypothetical protein
VSAETRRREERRGPLKARGVINGPLALRAHNVEILSPLELHTTYKEACKGLSGVAKHARQQTRLGWSWKAVTSSFCTGSDAATIRSQHRQRGRRSEPSVQAASG